MKVLARITLVVALLLPVVSLAAERTWTGVISDSSCGAKHTMMPGKSDKVCTQACIQMGSKYVLVVGGKNVYQLSDQKAPEPFAGDRVRVSGTLDAKTKTIQVASIKPAAKAVR